VSSLPLHFDGSGGQPDIDWVSLSARESSTGLFVCVSDCAESRYIKFSRAMLFCRLDAIGIARLGWLLFCAVIAPGVIFARTQTSISGRLA